MQRLPDFLQTLILSHYFDDMSNIRDQTIDLDVSHMKDLHILMCIGYVNVLSSLPRSICWFQHFNQVEVYVGFPIIPQNNELAILEFRDSKLCSV